MSDDDLRQLERAAKDEGGAALARLAAARLRAGSGLLWLWVANHGNYRISLGDYALRAPAANPVAPPNTIEVTVSGFMDDGYTIGEHVGRDPPPPLMRQGWVSACLDIRQAVFGDKPTGGTDVTGPMIYDIETWRVASVGCGKDRVELGIPERRSE